MTSGGLSSYVTKYATKCDQKRVPLGFRCVGRFWGCDRATRARPVCVGSVRAIDLLVDDQDNISYVKDPQGFDRFAVVQFEGRSRLWKSVLRSMDSAMQEEFTASVGATGWNLSIDDTLTTNGNAGNVHLHPMVWALLYWPRTAVARLGAAAILAVVSEGEGPAWCKKIPPSWPARGNPFM